MIQRFLKTVAAACLAASMFTPSWAQPAAAAKERPAHPDISLPERKADGQRAVELLGDRLTEVAAHYGRNPLVFRSMLLGDRTNKIDRKGRWFVEEELQAALPQESALVTNGTLVPLADTFKLHSKPGASRTIYLNFRGATLVNTAWNTYDANGVSNTIVAQPFHVTNEGAVDTNFTTNELTRIQYIWQRVAEDFAPLDVDVTTEQPAAASLTRSSLADTVFGTTALITNRTGVYTCSCGGVAYVGTFDSVGDTYKPALVFWDALGSGEKNVAEAITHEVGHNGGLSHDGTATVGYYQGHGTGVTGWAPIMGVGYYQNLVQWSKGEYTGANQLQDDIQVMQDNGLPLRADDHGNSTAAATAMTTGTSTTPGNTLFSASGTIERPTDLDFFSFTAGAGTATITVSPSLRAPNLDALLRVYNSAGTQIGTANPVGQVNASVTISLPSAGTYFVSVQGTGEGVPTATGYSNYGSLGFYAVSADVPAGGVVNQPPVARITANTLSGTAPLTVNFSGATSTDADGTITAYNWTFGNGLTATGQTASSVYSAAGTYTAQLLVTDNGGRTGTQSVTVTVAQPVQASWVGGITMGLRSTRTTTGATAAVTVRGGSAGALLPGAVVTGTWSGAVSGTASATAASNGVASFTSPTARVTTGTITFTVTNITRAGYTYTPTSNVRTSASITR